MFDKDAVLRIRGSCNCNGGEEGEWMMKIAAKKNQRLQSRSVFLDVYRHLAEPDDEADRPHST